MIASAARPQLFERRPHWGEGQSFHRRLALEPLSNWQSRRLVAEILQKVTEVPQALRDLIVAGTEGNPFFIEELIKMLVEDGVILKGEEEWHVEPSRLTETRVPPTLTGVLQARVDRLRPEERTVLQQASVVGRLFWDRAVTRINASAGEGIDESGVTACLSALRGREMVFQRETSTFAEAEEYIFKHALLREVTYESVLKRLRRAYHGLVADWLLEQSGERLEEYTGLIADHLELAGRTAEAVGYLMQAGDRAQRQYANEEAISYFRRALTLLEDTPPDATRQKLAGELYERLGEVLALTGEYDEARAAYQNALGRTPADDRIRQGRLHGKAGDTWAVPRRFEEAMKAYDRAETALGRESAEIAPEWWQEWIEIQLSRADVHYFRGEVRELAELVEKMQPVVEHYGTPLQRVYFFLVLVLASNRRNRFVVSQQTLAYSRAYLEAAQESGSLQRIAHARFVLGFNLLWRGEFAEAREQMKTALELAVRIGNMILQTQCLTYLTVVFRKSGQVEETTDFALRSLEAATTVQNPAYIGAAQANLAWVTWKNSDLTEALERGKAALEPWQQSETGFMFQWLALFPLTSVALAHDRIAEAVEYARRVLEPAQQALPDPLQMVLEGAIEAWESGEPEATRRYFDRALELAQEMGYL
jgi:tetratricopeptide (TPR) repeat protein